MTPHRSPSPTVAAGGSSRRCCQTTRAPQWCCEEHLGGTPSPTRLGGCSIGDRAWRRGIPWWSPGDSCGGVAVEDVGPVPASTRRKLGQRGVHGLLWWRTGARAKDTGARHTARHGPCLDKPGTRVGAGGAPPPLVGPAVEQFCSQRFAYAVPALASTPTPSCGSAGGVGVGAVGVTPRPVTECVGALLAPRLLGAVLLQGRKERACRKECNGVRAVICGITPWYGRPSPLRSWKSCWVSGTVYRGRPAYRRRSSPYAVLHDRHVALHDGVVLRVDVDRPS